MENREEFTDRLLQAVEATTIPRKFEPPLSQEDAIAYAHQIKAIGDPSRLRILNLLSQHGGEITVFEMVEIFRPLAQPTISWHLGRLSAAGLVDFRKSGLHRFYYVRKDTMKQVQAMLSDLVN